MAQTLNYATYITRKFMEVLHSNTVIAKNINHEYEDMFARDINPSGKAGPSVNIRMPVLTSVRTSWPMAQQDITETYRTLTVDQVLGVDLNFSDSELSLITPDNMSEFSARYIETPAKLLASKLDANIASYMQTYIPNSVFTTAVNTNSVFLTAGQKIKENLAPMNDELYAVVQPSTEAAMVGGLAGLYNPQGRISDQYEKGQMSNALGFKWYMSQLLPSIATGSATNTSPLIATATNGSTTIQITGGTTSGTYKAGQVFKIVTSAGSDTAGCKAVNFETKDAYARNQEFVITEAKTASGGAVTLSVWPAPTWSGVGQNIDVTPVSKYMMFETTASTTYGQDLCFHKDAFSMVSVPLAEPKGMDMAKTVTYDGLSIRFVRGYDIVNARFLSRMDIYFGRTYLRPEWACKIVK